jgi:hypothetical protein
MLRFPAHAVLALGAAVVAAGCGSRARDYTPSPDAARASLQAALRAWQGGQPVGAIDGSPRVQVVDTTRRTGQTLRTFEVLGETSHSAQGRCYIVRLALDNPAADERARYVVVGIDPIWVFRKEDYDHLGHWEHPMEVPELPPADSQAPAAAASAAANPHERS